MFNSTGDLLDHMLVGADEVEKSAQLNLGLLRLPAYPKSTEGSRSAWAFTRAWWL